MPLGLDYSVNVKLMTYLGLAISFPSLDNNANKDKGGPGSTRGRHGSGLESNAGCNHILFPIKLLEFILLTFASDCLWKLKTGTEKVMKHEQESRTLRNWDCMVAKRKKSDITALYRIAKLQKMMIDLWMVTIAWIQGPRKPQNVRGARGAKHPSKYGFSGFIAFLCDNFWN